MKNLYQLLLVAVMSMSGFLASAQQWSPASKQFSNRVIPALKQYDFSIDDASLKQLQSNEIKSIDLPNPRGENITFDLTPTKVMSDKLAAKFPSIKTYIGKAKKGITGRITITHKGVRAMVFAHEGIYFIDPISLTDKNNYQAYFKKDLDLNSHKTHFPEDEPIIYNKEKFAQVKQLVESNQFKLPPSGPELRTYRIAIAATGEYTQFHGGTVTDAMAAIATTMARVNGIYEREVAITMVLVDNNDQLIYTDASSDPFTNGSAGAYIDEVQAEIDDVIGNDNYDIGHGFSTGAGGLAGLGVVCETGRKGSGVTGTNSPIGDPYDVDYVAHEIGHQFGGPHTFNGVNGSCAGGNRSGSTAYEPGSGVTIMAYAGICGNDNIANNSIPFFHASSLEYITVYSQDANGNSCAETSDTGNNIPEVEAGAGGFTIPISTPFQLNGSATDPDGDNLTYSWEQFDLGPAGEPNSPEGNAPLFRTFVPSTDSFRIFPQISDIINGTQTKGEILPDYARDMSFILTVRDDQAVSGVNNDLISFSVSDVAGPFTVEEVSGSYSGYENITVNWDVAGTNQSPVNCSNVNIYISDDNGTTFDYLVKENTANDGTEVIELPNINSDQVKVKVAAAQNIFFNIAPGNITIAEATEPTFTIATSLNANNYCPEDDIVIDLSTQSILSFTEQITFSTANLSADLSANFTSSTINPGEATTLTLTNAQDVSGVFEFDVVGTTNSIEKSYTVNFTITNNPVAPEFTLPAVGETTGLQPTFEWTDSNLLSTYDLDIATDEAFSNIVESIEDISDKSVQLPNQLESATTYFARLSAKNSCGTSAFETISFTTAEIDCISLPASDLPISIGTTPETITSTLSVGANGTIESVEVLNISLDHTYISDLTFILESPEGTQVILLTEICGSDNNLNLSFSDITGNDPADIPCPPTDGNTYLSEEPLSAFNGESTAGDWKLIVIDGYNEDGGALNNWELKLCASNTSFPPATPTTLSVTYLSDLAIELAWVDNSDDEELFEIYRSLSETDEFEKIGEVQANVLTYSETLPTVNDTYFYKVLASNATTGSSTFSNVVEINGADNEMVAAPTQATTAYVEKGSISLSWTDNSDNELFFLIERKMSTASSFELIDSVQTDVTSYEDVLPTLTDTYNYRVYGRNEYVNSAFSNVVNASIAILANKNLSEAGISLYPNPVENELNIVNSNNIKISKLSLIDISGKQVAELPTNREVLDLSQFEAGMYILSIQSGNQYYKAQILIK